jgi:thiamine-monophosphate kinase
MNLSEAGELALLEILRKKFRKKPSRLVLGIGDDAAVIKAGKTAYMLLTTDMMVEGVHFDLRWTTPFQLGFKLVSVNVSDIYAMGGRPEFLLLNFAAPGHADIVFFNRLFDGIKKATEVYDLTLVGGDVSSSDKVVLSATVTGHTSRILSRKGARVGDRIYVTGHLGDSACGLELMKRIKRPVEIEKKKKTELDLEWTAALPLITRHLMPRAVKPDRFVRKATSMIDISDGLLIDLSRLCRESRVGAVIYAERIPISDEMRKAAVCLGTSADELAMGGGEDYELLLTAPEDKKIKAFCIGEIVSSGMKIIDGTGKKRNIAVRGYRHFAV